jgi:hypothetical protein
MVTLVADGRFLSKVTDMKNLSQEVRPEPMTCNAVSLYSLTTHGSSLGDLGN